MTEQGECYFLPYDVDRADVFATAIPKSDISRVFNQPAGTVIVFLDTCHAGGIQTARKKGPEVDINGLVNELVKAGQGVVVFASSTENQVSLELDEHRHGAFALALLEGLDGRADRDDRVISTNELDLYVSNRVKELTKGEQHPATAKPDTTPDLRLFMVP